MKGGSLQVENDQLRGCIRELEAKLANRQTPFTPRAQRVQEDRALTPYEELHDAVGAFIEAFEAYAEKPGNDDLKEEARSEAAFVTLKEVYARD